MTRKKLYTIVKSILNTLSRIEVSGYHHVPKEGPAIIAMNHIGRVDVPLMFVTVERQDMAGLKVRVTSAV